MSKVVALNIPLILVYTGSIESSETLWRLSQQTLLPLPLALTVHPAFSSVVLSGVSCLLTHVHSFIQKEMYIISARDI